MTPIRLHVDATLSAGAAIEASPNQAHHLGSVMRRTAGDRVRLFNGHDGEWEGRIASLVRGKATLLVETLVRPQQADLDLWLVFALLKRDTTDLVVQKATELGVAVILPVITERTNAARVNENWLRAIAIEAAEQSERLTVPRIGVPGALDVLLSEWPNKRALFVAMERADLPPPEPFGTAAALLVGPEGGLGPRDRALLTRCDFVRQISLGPRVLRAETAAIVGLALLQRPACG